MRNLAGGLLALPASLLTALVISPVRSQDWPYNLPTDAKYYPEHEIHIKRNLEVQKMLNTASPAGMRKMSDDQGEKFFLDYWQFDDQTSASLHPDDNHSIRRSVNPPPLLFNASASEELLPPILLHGRSQHIPYLQRLFARSYQCPTGTNSCESIGQPDSCCATGETCMNLSGSDGATVGCCPSGATCGGQVGLCNIDAGYTSCDNGGCCIPGYTCQGVGCKTSRSISFTGYFAKIQTQVFLLPLQQLRPHYR